MVRTSNPGAREFQDLHVANDIPLWQHIATKVSHEWNDHNNLSMVIGATYPSELAAVRHIAPQMTFLVPGVGTQGGDAEKTVRAGCTADGLGLIINASRSIIFADDPAREAKKLRDEINNYR